MSSTPGPMMSPPPGEDSMGYGIPGMNGSGYSGVSHLVGETQILDLLKYRHWNISFQINTKKNCLSFLYFI